MRWVRPEGIHLTLKFLGQVGEQGLQRVRRVLGEAAQAHRPFTLDLTSVGAFPDMRRPRVVWVGVEEREGELARLQAALERGLARLGFEAGRRPFHPHLTLGRVRKSATASQVARLGAALAGWRSHIAGSFEVGAVTLFRSDLRPEGAVYTSLGKYLLEGRR